MRSLSRLSPVLLLGLLLTACGFHLRGALDLSDDMAPVYVDAGSVQQLGRDIRSLLQDNGVAVTDSMEQAKTVLALKSESRQNRVLSVDSNGRAREYLLVYTAAFSMQVKPAKAEERSLQVSRSLLFDENAVLAFANEADVVYEELRRDAARQILQKLQAYSSRRKNQP